MELRRPGDNEAPIQEMTGHEISVLRKQIPVLREEIFTEAPDSCTTGIIMYLENEFLYYAKKPVLRNQIPVPREAFCTEKTNSCTAGRNSVLRKCFVLRDDFCIEKTNSCTAGRILY